MDFKALENERSSTPTPPTVQLQTTEELYEWAENHGPKYRPARLRTTAKDPLTLLEWVSDQAEIVDAETNKRYSLQTNISYDTTTIQALNAVKQAVHRDKDLELRACQNNELNATELETALQKIEGSIEVTGKKVLEYNASDNTMIQIEAGYIDSTPGTEYGANIKQLNTQKKPNYTDSFAIFEEHNIEKVERIQEILENETGATFRNLL